MNADGEACSWDSPHRHRWNFTVTLHQDENDVFDLLAQADIDFESTYSQLITPMCSVKTKVLPRVAGVDTAQLDTSVAGNLVRFYVEYNMI
jgi:hypothetical protein